jgi:hypothetical protein
VAASRRLKNPMAGRRGEERDNMRRDSPDRSAHRHTGR